MPAPTINPRKVNPDYSDNLNQLRYGLSNLPYIGDVLRAYDNVQKTKDYLYNRGISWDDVKYPSLLNGGVTSSMATMPSEMLSAVEKLYDDREENVSRARDKLHRY